METEEQRIAREQAEATAATQAAPAAPLIKSTTNSSGSTTRTILGPGEVAANAGAVAAHSADIPLIEKDGQLDAQRAKVAEISANEKIAAADEFAAKRALISDGIDKDTEAAVRDHHMRVERHANTKLTDFWVDKTNGQKATAAVAQMVGGLGVAFARAAGHYEAKNGAEEVLNNAIERDYRTKRDAIEKQKDEIELSKGRMMDFRQRKADALRDLDAQEAAKREKIALHLEKAGASIGTEDAINKAALEANKVRQGIAGLQQKIAETARQSATSHWNKQTIEADANYMKGGAAKNNPLSVYGPDGQRLFDAPNSKVADKANSTIANAREAREIMVRMRDGQAKGGAVGSFDEYQQRSSDMERLKVLMKNDQELGALIGSDIKILSGQTGGVLENMLGKAGPKLNNSIKALDSGLQKKLDGWGANGSQIAPQIIPQKQAGAPLAKPMADARAEARAWLEANPGHPKAAAVRAKLGL